MENTKNRLLQLIKTKALVTGEEITLTSGLKSRFYIDGKTITMDPEGAHLLAHLILDILAAEDVRAIGGPTIGADPIVGAVAALSHEVGRPLPGFIVRKAAKTHGRMKQIEGYRVGAGDRVALVEDVVTTGGSVLDAAAVVEQAGGSVSRIIALVDRQQGAAEAFAGRGYPFTAVFTADAILE